MNGKDEKGRFGPGNPGRPPGSKNKAPHAIKELARENAPSAIRTLVRIANDQEAPTAAQVSAANSILDRAYGKPSQALEIDANVETTSRLELDVSKMNDEELAEYIALGERILEIEKAANHDQD